MKALVFDSKKGYSETFPIRAMRLDKGAKSPGLLAQVPRLVGAGVEKGRTPAPLQRVEGRFLAQACRSKEGTEKGTQ